MNNNRSTITPSAKMVGNRPVLFETDEMLSLAFSMASDGKASVANAWDRILKSADTATTANIYDGNSATKYRLTACPDMIKARYLALVYLGTKEKRYFDGAMSILLAYAKSSPMLGTDETLDYSSPTIDGQSDIGLNIALPLTTFCEVYSLLYPYLDASDKTAMQKWIRIGADLVKKGHEYWIANDYYDQQYGNNHLSCHLMGIIAAAYALEDDDLLSYALDVEKNPACLAEMIDRAILMEGDEVWYRDIDSDFVPGEIYDRYRVVQNNGFAYAIYHLKFLTNCAAMLKNNGVDYFSYVGKNGENLRLPYLAYAEYLLKNDVNAGVGHYKGSPMSRSDTLFSYHIADFYYNDETIRNVIDTLVDEGEISWDKETFGHSAAFIYSMP